MLQKAIDAVHEFHIAKEIDFHDNLRPFGVSRKGGGLRTFWDVDCAVSQMKTASKRMLHAFKTALAHSKHDYDNHDRVQHGKPDYRFLRVSLILEEVAELVEAIMEGDQIGALDGMADSVYVINGTAVTYNLPLNAAFAEVHRSNMSKAVTGPRLEDKGAAYTPPNLQKVLEENHACVPMCRRSVLHSA